MPTTRITFIHLITVLLIAVLFCIVGCNKEKPIVPDEQKFDNFYKSFDKEILLPLVQLDSIRVIKIADQQVFGEPPDICFCFEGRAENGSYDYSKNTADQVLNNVLPDSLPQTITLGASYKFNVSETEAYNSYFEILASDLDSGWDTCGYYYFLNFDNTIFFNGNLIDDRDIDVNSFKYSYDNGYKSIYIKANFITYKLFFHFEN